MKRISLIISILILLLSSCKKKVNENILYDMSGYYEIKSFSINGKNKLSKLTEDYLDSTEFYFWYRGRSNDGGYLFTFTSTTKLKDTTYYNITTGGFTDESLSEFYIFLASQKLYPGTNNYMAGITIITKTFPPLKPYQWHVDGRTHHYISLSTTYKGDTYKLSLSKY